MAKNSQPRQSGKPTKAGRSAAKAKPGDGFLGWLGRQVGHVKKGMAADVTPAKSAKKTAQGPRAGAQAARPSPRPAEAQHGPAQAGPAKTGPAVQPQPPPADGPSKVVYRKDKIEEAEMPDQPGVKLRRTTIDEIIVEEQ